VTPESATNRAGEEHLVVATVRDAAGDVMPGVTVTSMSRVSTT